METNQNREGEGGVIPFRSGRFIVVANNWYFATREGMNKGPYSSKPEAETALKLFIEKCKELDQIFH